MDDEKMKASLAVSQHNDQGSIQLGSHTALKKRLNVWSALGVSFSATCAPIAILIFLSLTVGQGGSPIFIYSYIVAVLLNMTVCLSLAEMASARPHSSGQIFWSAEFAPEGKRNIMSYFTGFFAVCTWVFWYISAPLITAQLIMATTEVVYPDFVAQQWQVYLTFLGILASTYVWNIHLFSSLERLNRCVVLLINAGSLYIFVTLLVRASPKRTSSDVWLNIVNANGWGTGVNFILSFLPGLNAVSGFDSAAHLAEEMERPDRNVPIVMVGSAVLSGLAAFIMAVASAYCTTNPENLLNAVGGEPGIQLMLDSFGLLPFTIIGSLIFVLVLNNAATSLMTVSSRMTWAMARQNGLPFSGWLGKLGSKSLLPVNATIAAVVAAVAVGAIQMGSTVVINAILGSAIICCNVSYAIPIVQLMLLSERREVLGRTWFSLGSWGFVINLIAVLWLMVASVCLSFPTYQPIDPTNMNFASAFAVLVGILGIINWYSFSRKHYQTPRPITWE